MRLIKESANNAFTPENLARLFKDDLAKYVAIKKDASYQYRDYKLNVAGMTDSATDRAYRQEYSNLITKADKILAKIQAQLPPKENVDMAAVVNAYRKLTKKGGIDDKTIPLPKKQVINTQTRSQALDDMDWNKKVGENFILYPSRERYEVTHSVEGDPYVVCTNLDTEDTETFEKGELTYLFHQNKIKFI